MHPFSKGVFAELLGRGLLVLFCCVVDAVTLDMSPFVERKGSKSVSFFSPAKSVQHILQTIQSACVSLLSVHPGNVLFIPVLLQLHVVDCFFHFSDFGLTLKSLLLQLNPPNPGSQVVQVALVGL